MSMILLHREMTTMKAAGGWGKTRKTSSITSPGDVVTSPGLLYVFFFCMFFFSFFHFHYYWYIFLVTMSMILTMPWNNNNESGRWARGKTRKMSGITSPGDIGRMRGSSTEWWQWRRHVDEREDEEDKQHYKPRRCLRHLLGLLSFIVCSFLFIFHYWHFFKGNSNYLQPWLV